MSRTGCHLLDGCGRPGMELAMRSLVQSFAVCAISWSPACRRRWPPSSTRWMRWARRSGMLERTGRLEGLLRHAELQLQPRWHADRPSALAGSVSPATPTRKSNSWTRRSTRSNCVPLELRPPGSGYRRAGVPAQFTSQEGVPRAGRRMSPTWTLRPPRCVDWRTARDLGGPGGLLTATALRSSQEH